MVFGILSSFIIIETMFSKRTRNSLSKIKSNKQKLTFEQLKIYYQEKGFKLNERFSSSLELLTDDGDYNYVAYLLSDENNISMQVAKYNDNNKIDVIESNEYGYCSLIKAANNILNKFVIENRTFTKITGTKRIETYLFDKVAVREAIINAIVHNDYSNEQVPLFEIFDDKIVITSAGGLPENYSKEELLSGVLRLRNKELIRVFKDVDLVEQLGSGVKRIVEAYGEEVFKILPNTLQVIIPLNKNEINQKSDIVNDTLNDTVKLNEKELDIYNLIKDNPSITIKEIVTKSGISIATVNRTIKNLKDKNLIDRVGSDKTGCWKIY